MAEFLTNMSQVPKTVPQKKISVDDIAEASIQKITHSGSIINQNSYQNVDDSKTILLEKAISNSANKPSGGLEHITLGGLFAYMFNEAPMKYSYVIETLREDTWTYWSKINAQDMGILVTDNNMRDGRICQVINPREFIAGGFHNSPELSMSDISREGYKYFAHLQDRENGSIYNIDPIGLFNYMLYAPNDQMFIPNANNSNLKFMVAFDQSDLQGKTIGYIDFMQFKAYIDTRIREIIKNG